MFNCRSSIRNHKSDCASSYKPLFPMFIQFGASVVLRSLCWGFRGNSGEMMMCERDTLKAANMRRQVLVHEDCSCRTTLSTRENVMKHLAITGLFLAMTVGSASAQINAGEQKPEP